MVGETSKLRLDIDWTPEMMFSELLYCFSLLPRKGLHQSKQNTLIKGQSPELRGTRGSIRAWEGCQQHLVNNRLKVGKKHQHLGLFGLCAPPSPVAGGLMSAGGRWRNKDGIEGGVMRTDGVRRSTADLKGSLIQLIWTTSDQLELQLKPGPAPVFAVFHLPAEKLHEKLHNCSIQSDKSQNCR